MKWVEDLDKESQMNLIENLIQEKMKDSFD